VANLVAQVVKRINEWHDKDELPSKNEFIQNNKGKQGLFGASEDELREARSRRTNASNSHIQAIPRPE
jgi:hypothetical protein